ncbi:nucleoside/nucleotide kinase family protein [Nocardia africana]|uniref:Pantothenate kinase n=1 Tax=Nocardia africana TaxID=134964 RepID=A0A378WN98_9NOCA|nr:nucleoside/nucleotide kinase family protein [Nocardia africana]MCC3315044.1 nucleoside/nucleotide kinase family protein [Nocardia africana]SUA42669.1 Pantothenate kinase [Nocardia africana]
MTDGVMGPRELAARIVRAAEDAGDHRYLVGVAGPPGAGKSTLARGLAEAVRKSGVPAEVAGMDGFHLSSAVLRDSGALGRKGQPDTFDVASFVARLRRLRDSAIGVPVPWPVYDRARHDPVPDAVTFAGERVAIVEGNYLLLDRPGWREVRGCLDEVWYLDAEETVIEQRLLRRHLRGGKSPDRAQAMVAGSDLPNARLIARTADRADLVLRAVPGGYRIHPRR